MISKYVYLLIAVVFFTGFSVSQNKLQLVDYNEVTSGAARFSKYVPHLVGKKVAVVANQTSLVGTTSLVDTLLSQNVDIKVIFCPEHGFRGTVDAGEKVEGSVDLLTGIPIVSLYGSHRKPTNADLEGVDVVVFDLQDVGTRFYTYISTMTYVMEACAENSKDIIILDRPNPNGYFVDGPIMEEEYCSFVGLHPIPIVYGMTIGEYAKMVVGQKWINNASELKIRVIPLSGYDHNMIVKLPVAPSPNLPNWQSVYLYPSLCLFEGTVMSIGRGTEVPFQIYGHPDFLIGSFAFTPESRKGATNPKYLEQHCTGINLDGYANNYKRNTCEIHLKWLIDSYNYLGEKSEFFNNYFVKLAGTANLQKQIEECKSEAEIRDSWQPGLENFMKIREKYIIYQ